MDPPPNATPHYYIGKTMKSLGGSIFWMVQGVWVVVGFTVKGLGFQAPSKRWGKSCLLLVG